MAESRHAEVEGVCPAVPCLGVPRELGRGQRARSTMGEGKEAQGPERHHRHLEALMGEGVGLYSKKKKKNSNGGEIVLRALSRGEILLNLAFKNTSLAVLWRIDQRGTRLKAGPR